MYQENIPSEINTILAGESADFVVKARRGVPFVGSLMSLGFSVFWLLFSSLFVLVFFGPLFMNGEVAFTSNDVPVVASWDNLGPLLMPAGIIGIFVIVGIILVISSIFSFFIKGAWYIGTAKRLIIYKKGFTRSIDWEEFTGSISVRTKGDRGSINLVLRTGRMVSRDKGPDQYVPEKLDLIDIPNAQTVEQSLRKRIKENDPTPTAVVSS